MTYISYSSAPTNSTAAYFRAWGKALCDAILACGWVQTADSGQIDWTTVAVPTTARQAMGYLIVRTNDGLTPLYLKISFGSGYNASEPSTWVQVATGTDGAGTLTGAMTGRVQLCIYGNQSSTTLMPCHVSGDPGRLLFVLWPESSVYRLNVCAIERTTDAAGARSSEEVTVLTFGAGGGYDGGSYTDTGYSQTLSFTSQLLGSQGHWNATLPPSGTASALNNTALFPVRSWFYGEGPASLQVFMYCSSDLPANNPVMTTLWDGTYHKVLPLGIGRGGMYYNNTGCLAIRVD